MGSSFADIPVGARFSAELRGILPGGSTLFTKTGPLTAAAVSENARAALGIFNLDAGEIFNPDDYVNYPSRM